MASSVWKFNWSNEEIVEKLSDIMIHCNNTSQIRLEWSYRGELCMEPAGWDALWRIPKEKCHKLGVRYPCIVYVSVESLDWDCRVNTEDGELCASFEVIGVQDDEIHLPAKHETVSILELWPLKRQPNSAIDVKPTAEFIDLYRYFYTYIWMPWDMDWEEACSSWFQNNVPARVIMWANSGAEIHELRTIRDEAKSLAIKIGKYQAQLPSDTEDDALDLSSDAVNELMAWHEKMLQLKSKWQTFQNPTIRKPEIETNLPPKNISIWTGGNIDSYINHLRQINKNCTVNNGNDTAQILHCSPSLEAAIASNPPKASTLFLCSGEHSLPSDNVIGKSLTLKSLSNDVKLVCHEERAAALTVIGSLTLNKIQISADDCSTVLSIRSGDVVQEECKFKGNSKVTSQAIIVFGGSYLKIDKCTFDGFFTGIMAHKGSTVIMENCTFSECGVGVQISEGAKVSMVGCIFRKCTESGIRYDVQGLQHSIGGDCSLLKSYDRDILCMECVFKNNTTHNVFIAKQDENSKPEWEINEEEDSES